MKPRLISALPTLLTLGNLACGFGAITIAAKLGPESVPGVPSSPNLLAAALLIFLAMLFDMLDGTAARLTKSSSEIGAQLDSLCDAVSFGVAPAFLMLQFVRYEQPLAEFYPAWFTYPSRFVWTIAALYVCCAILRLARFNVETEEDDTHEAFEGLPSPAAAGTVCAFPIAMREFIGLHERATAGDTGRRIEALSWVVPAFVAALPLVTLAVAALMVSTFRYTHVFSSLAQNGWRRRDVIGLVFGAAVVFWLHELALLLLFAYFAFSGPTRWAWSELRQRSNGTPAAATE